MNFETLFFHIGQKINQIVASQVRGIYSNIDGRQKITLYPLYLECKEIVVEGHRGRGIPQKTWDEVMQGDRGTGQSKMAVCYQVNPSNPC